MEDCNQSCSSCEQCSEGVKAGMKYPKKERRGDKRIAAVKVEGGTFFFEQRAVRGRVIPGNGGVVRTQVPTSSTRKTIPLHVDTLFQTRVPFNKHTVHDARAHTCANPPVPRGDVGQRYDILSIRESNLQQSIS